MEAEVDQSDGVTEAGSGEVNLEVPSNDAVTELVISSESVSVSCCSKLST